MYFGCDYYPEHGILDYSGTPTRRYEEIKKIGRELKRIPDFRQ